MRLYGDNFLLSKLEGLRDEIRTDIERHDEHNVLSYAIEELNGLYDEIDNLEESVYNLEEELFDIDDIIDRFEEYYGWTVEQLKDRAEARGLKVSGTKQELVRRLFEDNRKRGEV